MLSSLQRVSSLRPATASRNWTCFAHSLAGQSTQGTSQKVHRARVNTLLFGADRLLLTSRADTLESYLMAKLSDTKFYNTYRSTAFTRLIRFCLERQLFEVALALHDRMLAEGFLAVHSLSLRMAALDVVRKAKNLKDVIPRLHLLFEEQAYDVPAFLDLIHYLDDKRRAAALIDELAYAFVSVRQIKLSEYPDLVGELASINMRGERLDAAQKWLQIFEDTCGTQDISPDVTPYSDIMNTFRDIDPKNSEAIQDVLFRMKSAGVSPDVSVFNALIRVNLVQKRYQEAFSLYHVLMEKRSHDLMPNDVTYKMLFRATHLLSRTRVARRHKPPDNVVPPRRLFREMLACHLEQTGSRPFGRSTVVSVSVFHLALRTFMAREDYAAAFIIIRALQVFDFQPNLQTYLIVFVNLLHRIKQEVKLPRQEDSYRLADFLAHLRPNEDPDLHFLMGRIKHATEPAALSPIGVKTISHLLSLGEQVRHTDVNLRDVSTPSSPQQIHPHQRQAPVPTVAMLTGTEDVSHQRTFYSPVPLARIVYKALLGELFRKAVHRSADWDWKGAAGPIIEETEREMIPEGVSRKFDGLERQKWDGQGVLPFAAARMRRRRRSARGGREIAFDFES